MKSLTERILKLAEFDVMKTREKWSQRYAKGVHQCEGAIEEHARLLPLIKSLAEIIEKQSEALWAIEDTFTGVNSNAELENNWTRWAKKRAREANGLCKAQLKELGCGE